MEIPMAKEPKKKGPPSMRELLPPDPQRGPDGIPDPVRVRNPVGRPSKYEPHMLKTVMDIGSIGGSHMEMAVELGIDRVTFYRWTENNEEFRNAVKMADAAAQVWWERAARNGAVGLIDKWNPTTYIFHMKNRFKDDYREKPQAAQPDENGQVQVMSVTIDSRLLDADQRDILRQTLLAAKAAKDGTVIEGEYEEGEE